MLLGVFFNSHDRSCCVLSCAVVVRVVNCVVVYKVVEKSGHPDFPPVRSHRAQLRQWAQDRTVHSEKIGVIPFTFVDVIH